MTKPALRRETDVVLFRNDANWSALMHQGLVGFCSFSDKDSERDEKSAFAAASSCRGSALLLLKKPNKQKKNRLSRSGSQRGD